jgi:hypothetical protein
LTSVEQAAALVNRRRHDHERRQRLGSPEEGLELVERARGRFALALWHEQRVGLQQQHDPPRRHHRQGADRRHEPAHAGREPVAGRPVAGMDALHVERAQPLLDEPLELVRQRRLLHFVFAQEQVDRIGRGGLYLLADGGGRRHRHVRPARRPRESR